MSDKKIYQTKYVISGDIIERFVYEKNQFKGFESHNKKGKNKNGLNTSENRAISLNRARKIVIRTINSNPCLTKFLTLTFEENITDLDYANNEFKKWVKRVNYNVFKTKKSMMKYVAVIEFQKRGAVHYHILCNLPYIDSNELAKVWGHGFIRINKIKGDIKRFGSSECDNVGAYVCKYMTKDNDDPRLENRNCYLMSRNLDKPQEIFVGNDEKDLLEQVYDLDDIFTCLTHKVNFASTYTNEYTGTVIYNQFNLKRLKKQQEKLIAK